MRYTECPSCAKEAEEQSYLQIKQASDSLITLCNKLVVGITERMPKEKLLEYKEEIEETEEILLRTLSNKMGQEHRMLDKRMNAATENADNSNVLIISFTGSAVLIAILLGWLLSNSIVKPLNELKSFAQSVGDGNLDQKIYLKSNDEIGSLSRSFQEMSSSLEEKARLQKLSAETEIKKYVWKSLRRLTMNWNNLHTSRVMI